MKILIILTKYLYYILIDNNKNAKQMYGRKKTTSF